MNILTQISECLIISFLKVFVDLMNLFIVLTIIFFDG